MKAIKIEREEFRPGHAVGADSHFWSKRTRHGVTRNKQKRGRPLQTGTASPKIRFRNRPLVALGRVVLEESGTCGRRVTTCERSP